jgi:homoserine dehydrogenase
MADSLKLAVAGLGTVGTGLLDLLAERGEAIAQRIGRRLEVVAVSARTRDKARGGHDLSRIRWFDDPVALAGDAEADVFVELIGGEGDPAKAAVEQALKGGKHVVTANKALIARCGTALARLAEAAGVTLSFEAAVAGGIPVVKTCAKASPATRSTGSSASSTAPATTSSPRWRSRAASFTTCSKEAQALGYAEADPTFDIGGFDTAHKLAILTSLAFGTEVALDAIYVEGIEAVTIEDIRNAQDLGYKIKLLGVAARTEDGIEQRVHPTLVRKGSPIADVDGVFNAVAIKGSFAGDLMLEGRGAGARPTASSVVADICDIARGVHVCAFGVPARQLKPYRRARMRAHEGGYYVALELYDRPGEVAAVARILADEKISIASIVQRAGLAGTERSAAVAPRHGGVHPHHPRHARKRHAPRAGDHRRPGPRGRQAAHDPHRTALSRCVAGVLIATRA